GVPVPGARGGLLPGVGFPPALASLVLVSGVPVGAEDASLLLGAEVGGAVVHVGPLDHLVDGACRLLEPLDPLREEGPLAVEMLTRIDARIIEDPADLRERQTELAVDEDPVDPGQVRGVVEAISRPAASARTHQADAVPV